MKMNKPLGIHHRSKRVRRSVGGGGGRGRGLSVRFSTASHVSNNTGTRHNSSRFSGGKNRTSENRPQTQLNHGQSHIVCAISENLARETCVVSMDIKAPFILNVTKQSNSQNYSETVSFLSILSPDEVLINEGRKHSHLAQKVVERFRHRKEAGEDTISNDNDHRPTSTVVKFISRAFFDQTKGAYLLRKVARQDTYDSKSIVQEYILLASSHAVLQFVQTSLGLSIANQCLDVRTVMSYGRDGCPKSMDIDRSTILHLELLVNAKTGKKQGSLINTIDCTKTTVGNRLLRSTIMAPPCQLATIQARLDLVDTFLSDENLFYLILGQLRHLPPIDKMLSDIVLISRPANSMAERSTEISRKMKTNAESATLAQKGILSLVSIKTTLESIPSIASALSTYLEKVFNNEQSSLQDKGDASFATAKRSLLMGLGLGGPTVGSQSIDHELLRAIIFALTQSELEEIRNAIAESCTASTRYMRNEQDKRHQACFALKSTPGNEMIDILRKAYLKNVDDIYKSADEYAEKYGVLVKVKHGSARGYYLSVTTTELPEIFVQPIRGRSPNNYLCTTEEIQSLNIRIQDNIQDLLILTHVKIKELLDMARSKYEALASVSDAIALLDLCHSFADKVTLSKERWTRPVLTEVGPSDLSGEKQEDALVIQKGRYSIELLDSVVMDDGITGMIPNDTYCDRSKCLTILSGLNGSGKSTYLKQVAIIVLLGHCGGYVPADQAQIPVSYHHYLFFAIYICHY